MSITQSVSPSQSALNILHIITGPLIIQDLLNLPNLSKPISTKKEVLDIVRIMAVPPHKTLDGLYDQKFA